MIEILVRGECSRCGRLIGYGDESAMLSLTVPGRGAFAKTIFQAELVCKNQQLCAEVISKPNDPA